LSREEKADCHHSPLISRNFFIGDPRYNRWLTWLLARNNSKTEKVEIQTVGTTDERRCSPMKTTHAKFLSVIIGAIGG